MSLFVVRHQHTAETCPAKDPSMGAMLLVHLSEANAEKYGIQIKGEGVVDGQHTFYLIMEAGNQETVEQYMLPFQRAGSVTIMPASPCETVVERMGC